MNYKEKMFQASKIRIQGGRGEGGVGGWMVAFESFYFNLIFKGTVFQ